MAAQGGIRDRSRGWGSQADQGKRSKSWGQAELCTPSTIPGKSRRRPSKQLKDGENATFLSVESPSAGRAQDRAGGSAGEERLCHWETRVGRMVRICGGQ